MSYTFDPVRALRDMDLVAAWLDDIERVRNEPIDDMEMELQSGVERSR